ncbi:MAG TPA: SAM-dependent methyltransferase [Polyangiaceae bacterium]|nr:SAM-dependent methyltransferase [Polyangiaceae bacterium]
MTELVRNVSDTARWVATYRARESARKDALFSDPYADRMAGDRGRAIANAASRHSEWALITRTKLIDDIVRDLLADGTDTILNLAAGFDTRPYRLTLPESLRWVEADLPELIAEKEQLLADEKPRCRLERVAVDLSDAAARATFLERYTEGARRAAVITEGLVIYLEPNAVAELGRALLACPRVSSWVLDFNSPRIQAEISSTMRDALVNAPFKFAPPNGLAFFEALGWKTRAARSLFREGARLKRVPLLMRPFALLPEPNPRDLKNGRWSAVVRFERS